MKLEMKEKKMKDWRLYFDSLCFFFASSRGLEFLLVGIRAQFIEELLLIMIASECIA